MLLVKCGNHEDMMIGSNKWFCLVMCSSWAEPKMKLFRHKKTCRKSLILSSSSAWKAWTLIRQWCENKIWFCTACDLLPPFFVECRSLSRSTFPHNSKCMSLGIFITADIFLLAASSRGVFDSIPDIFGPESNAYYPRTLHKWVCCLWLRSSWATACICSLFQAKIEANKTERTVAFLSDRLMGK